MEPGLFADYRELEHRHWWFAARRRIFRRLLADQGLVEGGSTRVLDVGVGAGVYTSELARYGSVVAVEPDAGAAAALRGRGLEVLEVGATAIPLPDASVDLVTALDVLEHVREDRRALRELHRVLRPGGLLLLTVPAIPRLWSDHDRAAHHVRRYRRRALRGRLQEAGFAVDRLDGLNVVLLPVVAGARLAKGVGRAVRRPSPGAPPASDFALPPGPVNRLLEEAFAAERLLPAGLRPPVGVSLLALARRPPS